MRADYIGSRGVCARAQGCHCGPMPPEVYHNNDVTKRNDIIKKLLQECVCMWDARDACCA